MACSLWDIFPPVNPLTWQSNVMMLVVQSHSFIGGVGFIGIGLSLLSQ